MPAKKKAPGTRIDNRASRQRTHLTAAPELPAETGQDLAEIEVPKPPSGLLAASRDQWQIYWASRLARPELLKEVDQVVVERWIFAYDEWKRAINAVRKNRLVKGSTGQPVANPLMGWAQSREKEMNSCQAELGIGPKSRSSLGLAVGQELLTAAELNKMAEEDPDDGSQPDQPDAIEVDGKEILEGFAER
jgi:P27 family predicted phage terminase small subunit